MIVLDISKILFIEYLVVNYVIVGNALLLGFTRKKT